MNRAQRRAQAKGKEKQANQQKQVVSLQQVLAMALNLIQKGDLAQAEAACRQVLAKHPDNHDALQLLGVIAGRYEKWVDSANLMQRSLEVKPDQPNVWFNLARAYFNIGEFDRAINANSQAAIMQPDNPEPLYNRANAHTSKMQFEEAIADFKRALELDPTHLDAKRNLALTYKEIERYDECIALLTELTKERPNDADIFRTLALCHRDISNMDECRHYIDEAIRIQPNFSDAHYGKSVIHKYESEDDEHLQQMLALDKVEKDRIHQMFLHFGLGKAYDDLRDYDQAFAHYNQANACNREGIEYDTARVKGYFEKLKELFTKQRLDEMSKPWDETPEFTPIFILGMPRSGTTLVEQIIASHSQACGLGELEDLHFAVTGNVWEKRPDYLTLIPNMKPEDYHAVGRDYQTKLRRFEKEAFVCDKMPRNFHHIAMIKLALPHAKVVHCRRHPLDTCLSIYRKLFFGLQPFAYNQTELAEHYTLYHDLMGYWESVMPDFIHTVHYEQLVESPEEQVRALLGFCGLEWEDDCLNFHTSKRSVRTASAQQVRQPIYKDAVAGWKRYSEQIQPMIEVLGTDYEPLA
ncbi:MAG: sulfotransferase [Rickettsiales bacterium]|nr:sulfotransferase [Rickettsiales bacterium]